MSFVLTADQEAAYNKIVVLMTDPAKQFLVIDGFAGTGKTTLIKTFLEEWPQYCALSGGALKDYPVVLTATTNKAADALAAATGAETQTIHSLLSLRVVNTGYKETKLIQGGDPQLSGLLIVIDEASFIDNVLLKQIMKDTKKCKVLFLGDPCQLRPVNCRDTPVFDSNWDTAKLSKIVRQSDDSPIQKLSRALRDHVVGSPMPHAGVDNKNIFHMNQEDFEKSFIADCASHRGNEVRALSWTNDTSKRYNALVSEALSGNTDIKVGDIAVVNKQVVINRQRKLTTDSTVYVAETHPYFVDSYGVTARQVVTSLGDHLTQAQDHREVDRLLKETYASGDNQEAWKIENRYVDLRLMYSSTVNKSQGSTYDVVYIDLNDIGKCRDKDQVRRMLYVAVSRARKKVVFTGDI